MTGFQSKKAMANETALGYAEIDLQTLLLRAIKDLTMQVENLKARVETLEKYQRDDGK